MAGNSMKKRERVLCGKRRKMDEALAARQADIEMRKLLRSADERAKAISASLKPPPVFYTKINKKGDQHPITDWRSVMSEIANDRAFYLSEAWAILRRSTLTRYGLRCMRCGAKDVRLHVDHIRPRSRYPQLALDANNLQVLCEPCNTWKSDVYETDFRPQRHRRAVAL